MRVRYVLFHDHVGNKQSFAPSLYEDIVKTGSLILIEEAQDVRNLELVQMGEEPISFPLSNKVFSVAAMVGAVVVAVTLGELVLAEASVRFLS